MIHVSTSSLKQFFLHGFILMLVIFSLPPLSTIHGLAGNSTLGIEEVKTQLESLNETMTSRHSEVQKLIVDFYKTPEAAELTRLKTEIVEKFLSLHRAQTQYQTSQTKNDWTRSSDALKNVNATQQLLKDLSAKELQLLKSAPITAALAKLDHDLSTQWQSYAEMFRMIGHWRALQSDAGEGMTYLGKFQTAASETKQQLDKLQSGMGKLFSGKTRQWRLEKLKGLQNEIDQKIEELKKVQAYALQEIQQTTELPENPQLWPTFVQNLNIIIDLEKRCRQNLDWTHFQCQVILGFLQSPRANRIKGNVSVKSPAKDPETLEKPTELNRGDALMTGSSSEASVEFEDGSSLVLTSNTRLELPADSMTWRLMAYGTARLNASAQVSLKTPDARIFAGPASELSIAVDERGSRVSVISGWSRVEDLNSASQLSLKENQTALFKAGQFPVKAEGA